MNNDIIINAEMCDANDTIFIENEDKTYIVEQLTYFPFGDSEGQIGVRVYLN
jgi:hypothetical protein